MKKILKTIIRAIMLAIGLFMIVNGLILAVKANFTIGIILELLTGVIFGLWGLFFNKISLYTKKGDVWEGGSISMFSPVVKFTLFERFSTDRLEVSETMEVNGKRTFGFDEPIIYKRIDK